MSISQLARELLAQEIFWGLSPLQLTEIVRKADRVVYAPGDVIIEADAEGDAAIVLVAGEAVLPANDSAGPDRVVEPGSILGELAMLVDHVHTVTVVARSPVRALRISRDGLREQMLEDRGLADHFVDRIAERLHRVADELREIDARLAHSLTLIPAQSQSGQPVLVPS